MNLFYYSIKLNLYRPLPFESVQNVPLPFESVQKVPIQKVAIQKETVPFVRIQKEAIPYLRNDKRQFGHNFHRLYAHIYHAQQQI
jgi:hypothetical protein